MQTLMSEDMLVLIEERLKLKNYVSKLKKPHLRFFWRSLKDVQVEKR